MELATRRQRSKPNKKHQQRLTPYIEGYDVLVARLLLLLRAPHIEVPPVYNPPNSDL